MICNFCGLDSTKQRAEFNINSPCISSLSRNSAHSWIYDSRFEQPQQAPRTPLDVRYDLLEASFMRAMAKVGQYGAEKFGDANYKKSRMRGKDGPPNHILNHLGSYMLHEPYNHSEIGHERKYHLAAIAFNAMMEFWYEENMNEDTSNS